MGLHILKSGILSLVQDFGRYGHQHIGVTEGGPMDEHAFLWNNKLLANYYNASQIEITLGQFSCEFLKDTTIALSGADMCFTLNGNAIDMWQSYQAKKGDILECAVAKTGIYAYISVMGGFHVTPILGSSATVMRDGLGGLSQTGLALSTKDILCFTETQKFQHRRLKQEFIPNYDNEKRINVILGAQYDDFSSQMQHKFFHAAYKVTSTINRMGFRLEGEKIHCDKQNMISEAIALGAIQIPSDGQPIVLMRDHQTIGGYPKIGYVTRMDVGRLAQSQTGTIIYFQPQELSKAILEYKKFKEFFMM